MLVRDRRVIVAIIAWFAALFTGRVPDGLHNFIAGYLRYYTRVTAYGAIMADPFPPFGGGGEYPVDLRDRPAGAAGPARRVLPLLPRAAVPDRGDVLQYLLYLVAIGYWFVALFTGRVPEGLQTLGMFCLRFTARTNAYFILVNPRYPAFGDTPGSLPGDQGSLPPIP